MRLCIRCRHYKPHHITNSYIPWCLHSKAAITDPVDGSVKGNDARTVRSDTTLCGPEGVWWEERRSFVQRLLGRKEGV